MAIYWDTGALRDLIINHPDLPVAVCTGQRIWTEGGILRARLASVLDCEPPEEVPFRLYTSREEFVGDLSEALHEEGDGWAWKLERLIREYDSHWVDCILVEQEENDGTENVSETV